MQVEALQRYRGKGQQKVTVEHVHVHSGGQGIVGAVLPGEGTKTNRRNKPLHHQELPTNRAPRCGARTRSGKPCQSPAVRGKRRCRMHGGAPGSGVPIGNKNALRHGRYTAEAIANRRVLSALIRIARDTLSELDEQNRADPGATQRMGMVHRTRAR
jgi:glucans biosynthesis protein